MRRTILGLSYENPLRSRFDAAFFASIPEKPGVYLMHGPDGRLLYIGKARSLRARLSSYRHARPGSVGENIIELIESVAAIRWKICASESEATRWELELIHAVRPPYNIACSWPERYLFIGYRVRSRDRDRDRDRPEPVVEFVLTSRPEAAEPGFRLFGCFKHRRRTQAAYAALLRLAFAARAGSPRFTLPARLTRASPPYRYAAKFPLAWLDPLDRFLAGSGRGLLHLILNRMLENENIPAFMYAPLQDDLDSVREFFTHGPRATRLLKRRNGVNTSLLDPRKMDELITASLEEKWGPKVPYPVPSCPLQ